MFNCSDDDRFSSNNEDGWIEFDTEETTIAVTSRTTTITVPVNFTAQINKSDVNLTYDILDVTGTPSDVLTNLGSALTIFGDTNTNNIVMDIKPDAVATLIANGDIFFDIQITSASRGIPVGLSDGSATTVHRVNVLCGGEPPVGTYTIDMHDSYGDGWQTDNGLGGSGITVVTTDINGDEATIEFGMCSPYGGGAGTFLVDGACTGPASTSFFDATTTIDIGSTITGAVWNFPGDFYGEISFEIYKPNGDLLFAYAIGDPDGELAVSYCQ